RWGVQEGAQIPARPQRHWHFRCQSGFICPQRAVLFGWEEHPLLQKSHRRMLPPPLNGGPGKKKGALPGLQGRRPLGWFPSLFPTNLIDDHVFSYLLGVREKIRKGDGHGSIRKISERCFVHPIDEVSSLLEFDREEERAGIVYAFGLDALLVRTTCEDLAAP